LNRRFANGFTMTVSYTIAKTLEQVSLLNAQDVNLQNLTSSKLEKRLIQYDVPQQLSIIGTYDQLPVSPAGSGGNTIRMVQVAEVLLLQAADKYVRVVTASGEHLLRTPLKDLLEQLDPAEFWQIHRSTAVRADAIDSVQRDEAGRLHLSLRGCGERLVVSRLYAHRFRAL